jgi:hypothetical protein
MTGKAFKRLVDLLNGFDEIERAVILVLLKVIQVAKLEIVDSGPGGWNI